MTPHETMVFAMNVSEALSPEAVQVLLNDLKAYQQEQREDPSNHLPPYHCGLIQAQLGDHAAAVHSYQAAIERNPEFSQAYFNMALAYSAQALYSEAEQAYRQAIHYNPTDAEPWANLGALYEFHGKEDEALECYRKAVELNPDEGAARRQMGRILFARGNLEQAREVFQATVAHNDGDGEAWNNLGLIAFREEKYEEARGHYEKAVELDEMFAQAWNNLGNLHLKEGNETAAVGAYRRALTGDSTDPNIWFNLGEFFFKRDHPEAEKCLARVVELERDDLEAWEMLRQWYSRHPDYTSWKSVLVVLLAHRPDDLALLRELSYVHEKMGDHAEAIRVLKDVIALDPQDTTSRLTMTSLSLKRGQPMDAFAQMNLLESEAPEVLDMWFYLGQRLLYQGYREEAETSFMKVIAHRPEQGDAWQFLGDLAFAREQWELAFERYRRAAEINRNDKAIWLPLAERMAENGAHDKAAACLDQLGDHLRYLPEEWEGFLPHYERAGQGEAFLERLGEMMREQRLANRLWAPLAELWLREGRPERARDCLERLERPLAEIPGGEALLEQIFVGLEAGGKQDPSLREVVEQPAAPPSEEGLAQYPQPPGGEPPPVSENERLRRELSRIRKSLETDGGDFRAWFNGGNILFRLGEFSEAEAFFRSAIRLEPEEAKAWYNLGCAQEAQRNLPAAVQSFEKAVACDRAFAQAWNWLGVLHYHLRDDQAARRAYVRSLALDRASSKTWHNLGALYRRLGEAEKSAYCFHEVERLGGVEEAPGVVPHDAASEENGPAS
jgi:tetratricopeptide (TPR) repeat protein